MSDGRIPRVRVEGRPLLDTRTDMAIYLPRPEMEQQLRDGIRQGLNTLLEGPRGSGKTTLLRALMYLFRTESSDRELIYVRAAVARNVTTLLELIIAALTHEDSPSDPAQAQPGTPSPPTSAHGTGAAAGEILGRQGLTGELRPLRLITTLAEIVAGHPPVAVIVDDVDPVVGNQLFGVLRDEVWAVGALWIVTATPDGVGTLTKPPADAFFEAVVHVRNLSGQDAEDLLAQRLGHQVSVPYQENGWLPRRLLELARNSAPQEWNLSVSARARRDAEIAKLGRPAAMLVAALEQLGPISPSDERLLTELGWTSSRASQVLRQLLEAGHVTYHESRGTGPGRPSRLYELVATEDENPS